MDRRTQARQLAMQGLCQLDSQGDDAFAMLPMFFRESCNDELVRNLANQWCADTWKNVEDCDAMITTAAVKWQLSRLAMVDKNILRLGAFQLKFCKDIPAKVVINEAIELAKKYGSESSSAFVNGVLDAIRRELKS